MLIQIKDRRQDDIKLKKGAYSPSIDSFSQRIINFVKRLSAKPINIIKLTHLSNKKDVTHYLTRRFITDAPNLKQKYGLIYSIIDRYFDYIPVQTEPPKPEIHTQTFLKLESKQKKFGSFKELYGTIINSVNESSSTRNKDNSFIK